jgi:thiosulfate/3-mercaptopyruvate sulfurtransferase
MDALVSTEWLAAHLGAPDVRVVDGTWHLPQAKRDARAEFLAAHIPGAVFFDIDGVADLATSLPHMLPTPGQFAAAVGALGIGSGDRVVVYDVRGVVSAARVWWTFRAFGHEAVTVLDGGLRRWKAEGRPVESGAATPAPRAFSASLRPELVRDLAAMRANVASRATQVVDARSPGRFAGTEPEPRAGLRGGHIPGSLNLPYETLYRSDGRLKEPDELRVAMQSAGVDLVRPIVTSCGSGVTAAVLALALHRCGRPDVAIYDGSWSEWGSLPDTPIDK